MLYQLHAPQDEHDAGGLMAFTNSERVALDWQAKGGTVKVELNEVSA